MAAKGVVARRRTFTHTSSMGGRLQEFLPLRGASRSKALVKGAMLLQALCCADQ